MITDGIITLRAPEPSDVDAMYVWENDVTLWSEGVLRAPTSRKLLHDFVTFYNPDPAVTGQLRLVIELGSTQEAIGCVDLYDYDCVNRRAGVGIVIGREHQGRGYAKRAIELLSRYCAEQLGLHQLWAIAGRENRRSIHLFDTCGFKTCGSLRGWVRKGPRYTDALMFQLVF
ncbi:MAG: GNAT family N-acetyltransferase [Firmicutes bacterium]|nr:GNAT family N-acetyltransferase [Bacillota bacterium]MCM1401268.1 GNAT family N-acetyltransferase [Bacteroides sp.]MCM1477183.1 GNAT family N-acetyltransferase [Bacteroides sp.]